MPPKKVTPIAQVAGGSGAAMEAIDSTLTLNVTTASIDQPLTPDVVTGVIEQPQETFQVGSLDDLSSMIAGDPGVPDGATLSTLTGSQVQPGTPVIVVGGGFPLDSFGAGQSVFSNLQEETVHGLAVMSSRDGFWRCGRQWMKAETRVALSEFTEEEVARLLAEPHLSVRHVDLTESY